MIIRRTAMAEPILKLKEVSKYYTGKQAVVVGLNNIDLTLSCGEFVAVTGESGSGKSTLSHVIGGILPYESGELYFKGIETSHYDGYDWECYRRDNISFISQNYGILPSATVMKNVVSALILAGMSKTSAKEEAEKILRQVELWDLRRRKAAKLSSGQKQRLSIARALAKPAPILIADEPTGNLDPENSAKVISLLAEAAKDRLVILITHEFDETKDLATRHIVLQDGKVISDAELRPANAPVCESDISVRKRKNRVLSPYIARLQCSGRPVWTSIMIALFGLTAFAVFAFLGVFIISLDDTSTRIYDDSAFRNGSVDRLVVMRGDTGTFTEEDFRNILSVPHVKALERIGCVADAQYAYRDGVDYTTTYSETEYIWLNGEIVFDPDSIPEIDGYPSVPPYIIGSCEFTADVPFMKTVPMLPEGETFITEGRLPENFYEVVASDPELKIGDKVKVFLRDFKNWKEGDRLEAEMTVVGKTDRTDLGAGLFFHEDAGFFMRHALTAASDAYNFLYLPVYDLEDGFFSGTPMLCYFPALDESGQAFIPSFYFPIYKSQSDDSFDGYTDGMVLEFAAYLETPRSPEPLRTALDYLHSVWHPGAGMTLGEALEFFPSPRPGDGEIWIPTTYPTNLIEVSYNNFLTLTDTSNSDQVSITIDGYGYTDRVIDALNERGYAAISPYKLGATEQIPERVAERTQTLRVCAVALAIVIVLQIVLLRAMFGLETESYKLLSNIGLVSSVAKRSVMWQVAAFTAAGQLIGGVGIWLSAYLGIERIADMLTYLPAKYVLLLSGVHILAASLAALWISIVLKQQVYPNSGRTEDIAFDDEA